jgi:1-pyrroline dehydrogenase
MSEAREAVVIDPSNEQTIARIEIADAAAVAAAVERAHEAAPAWATSTPGERATLLLAIADIIDANADELASIDSVNVGKPIGSARAEIPYVSDTFRYFAGAARGLHEGGAGEYSSGATSYLRREPLGVVGLIAPWNFPLLEASWKSAPALAAGNTVVLKPSELTPLSTLRLSELLSDCLPDGVLNVVTGDGTTGAAMVDHPGISLISLTGDVATGKKVAQAGGARLARVHLELGGKAPALVRADADIATAAEALVGTAFANSGQDCTASCRIVVATEVFDDFVQAFVAGVAAIVVGDPSSEDTTMGPLVSQRHRDKVASFVDAALTDGARLVTGGASSRSVGWYYDPTVLVDVDQNDAIVQNEVFGPVVTIQRSDSDESMLHLANSVRYGLAASVWTNDLAAAMNYSKALTFGTVWVNDHMNVIPEMPFGGFRESGYGKELSSIGLEEYTQVKHVMIRA